MENKWRGWNIWTPKLSAAALFMIWSDLVILQQLCCNQLKVHLLKYKTVKSFNHASSQATFFSDFISLKRYLTSRTISETVFSPSIFVMPFQNSHCLLLQLTCHHSWSYYICNCYSHQWQWQHQHVTNFIDWLIRLYYDVMFFAAGKINPMYSAQSLA